MAAATVCAKCSDPLVLEVDNDDDDDLDMAGSSSAPKTVPDDLLLPCGDHMHWDCLMQNDNYELTKCPACAQDLAAGDQILVEYRNEGGLQRDLDILPLLREEAYLRAYPEETKCRAFIEFCREGDHRAVAELLTSHQTPDEDEMDEDDPSQTKTIDEILRYQDPLADMQSGLHAAVANESREVAWLLLLLASPLPESDFPALVFQEAASLGIMREDQQGKVDIRSLRDAHGRTAAGIAEEVGVIWNGWKERLSAP